ncbi:hypothetical protein IE81DRAFT_350372 [Ceraceosorus guamensis]|uniref:Elongation factor 1 alpha-like protein n=1 Tax=Ceraceosorus guamensis TaxID=1522189 RepID=A0A316VNR4_9BASI|nr:hypothetical protein IE81DRAFT_350372 [Ceraceosorus guamensis]PWN39216.1 hypothetical protein IE81DRAFT_350372 [Ceraceosorus guamensis]
MESSKTSDGQAEQLKRRLKDLDLQEGDADEQCSDAGSDVAVRPVAHEKILEEWRAKEAADARRSMSLVVVGHVDAGKSTLMGRLLHELGSLTDKAYQANARASSKAGKGSFAYAWTLDSSEEERSRGVTIDIAHDTFDTPHRRFALLDAPGHRDFIPNMISGAAMADAGLLVVDASLGAFEAGFGDKGQTREHAVLLRSLGTSQIVVAVNKLDAVAYDQHRFTEIVDKVKNFLAGIGFDTAGEGASGVRFVPCGAAVGENLSQRSQSGDLARWYGGPTLVEVLDTLTPPTRSFDAPLRIPVTNVFRSGQVTAISSGLGVTGRIVSGLVSVGDRLAAVPGDETGLVKAIELDGDAVPWAVAGSTVTCFLTGIDQIHVNIGSVLCPPNAPVPLVTTLLVRLLVFEPSLPLMSGTSLELFHHSSNIPCTITSLERTIDAKSGSTLKAKPRVLSRGSTAEVRISITPTQTSKGSSAGVPIEIFAKSRDMGRVVLRLAGESVAAGVVLEAA